MIAELSHEIAHGLITYPGLAAPERLVDVPTVLIHRGWSDHWGTERYTGPGSPHLDVGAVAALDGERLTALPAPVAGLASFPVRAVAVWPS